MRHNLFILFFCISLVSYAQLPMGSWKMHNAYSDVIRVEVGRNKVYGLSYGALMSVDKEDGLIEYYNKLNGLSSANISEFCYDKEGGRLLLLYSDGNIDLLSDEGDIINISDLYSSQTNESRLVNNVLISGRIAYMAMQFGILQLDLVRKELKDTYYIGYEAGSVNVKCLAECGNTLYAMTEDSLYYALKSSNMIDYHNWHTLSLPAEGKNMELTAVGDELFILCDSVIYMYDGENWSECLADKRYSRIKPLNGRLAAINKQGTDIIEAGILMEHISYFVGATDVDFDVVSGKYWFAYSAEGIGELDARKNTYSQYKPNGPITNKSYRLRITGDRLYVVPGGYWATKDETDAMAMYYENGEWTNYNYSYFRNAIGYHSSDYSDMVGDPNDPSHFFIAAFSVGMLEFRNNKFYKLHDVNNSPFVSTIADNPRVYTWVDGITFDDEGNLFIECRKAGLCMLDRDGKWSVFKNVATYDLNRLKQVIISNKNKNLKILVCNRDGAGIGVMDDAGTLYTERDDRAVFRHEFVDQNGKNVIPEYIYYIEQDLNGELWVGTSAGIFIIPDVEALFNSNECRRIIIPRTDGSGLADYLLSDERINSIAIDGANRKWIGTQGSGVYLMSEDGTETIEHFTTDNSPLPDNSILSIAINQHSGEVFIGTGVGLVSYQSDSAEAMDNLMEVYAYPNPVREDFEGMITISGLSENTVVKITDSTGWLVAEMESLGGLAVWDGNNIRGEKVSAGVYFAQCVSKDGNEYALVKILIMK